MLPITDRFTTHLKKVLNRAMQIARQTPGTLFEPKFLLKSLVQENGSIGREILNKLDLFPKRVMNTKIVHQSVLSIEVPPDTKKIIEQAVLVAHQHEHHYVGTEHLLYALVITAPEIITSLLKTRRGDLKKIKNHLEIIFENTKQLPLPTFLRDHHQSSGQPAPPSLNPDASIKQKAKIKTPALDFFTKNLNTLASRGELDELTGREEELDRLIQILLRRTKNNAIILGDPGVGKTALVEGLAQRLNQGKVPPALLGKRVLTLDLGGMVAGTMYRGEFEGRMKELLMEIEKLHHDVILFIDEIHLIVGSGSTTGSGMDAANLLKPALAKGSLHVIGATTYEEYKKYFEHDGALERRFQPLQLLPPTVPETKKILLNLAPKLEKFHQLIIPETVLSLTVELAAKHLYDRAMPDKAIDLLEEAAALVAMQARHQDYRTREKLAEDQLLATLKEKQELIKKGVLAKAEQLEQKENDLVRKLMAIKEQQISRPETKTTLTSDHLLTVLARKTHVPKTMLAGSELQLIDQTFEKLTTEIIGQEENLRRLINVLKRNLLGLREQTRPIGSFLLAGPTGTGKTSTAKLLAKYFFFRENALIRLDMSEFHESFHISKLIGSPPGYVGYREKTSLSDAVKNNPHAVILFDEIEKAHPDVRHLLLGILTDGELRDATGRLINFRHTIIILTSNAGSRILFEPEIGFTNNRSRTHFEAAWQDELKKEFPPELLARLDAVLIYAPLGERELAELAAKKLTFLKQKIKDRFNVNISFSPLLPAQLARASAGHREGARAILKKIETTIEEPLADWLIKKALSTTVPYPKVKHSPPLFLDYQNGKIRLAHQSTQ